MLSIPVLSCVVPLLERYAQLSAEMDSLLGKEDAPDSLVSGNQHSSSALSWVEDICVAEREEDEN